MIEDVNVRPTDHHPFLFPAVVSVVHEAQVALERHHRQGMTLELVSDPAHSMVQTSFTIGIITSSFSSYDQRGEL